MIMQDKNFYNSRGLLESKRNINGIIHRLSSRRNWCCKWLWIKITLPAKNNVFSFFFACSTFHPPRWSHVLWHIQVQVCWSKQQPYLLCLQPLIYAVSLLRLIKYCNWISEKVCFSMSDNHHSIYLLLNAHFLGTIMSLTIKQLFCSYISQVLLFFCFVCVFIFFLIKIRVL